MNRKTYEEMIQAKKKGQFSRREFLRAAGIGIGGTILAACAPKVTEQVSDGSDAITTSEDLGDVVEIATWPNYHNNANFDNFTQRTGVNVKVNVFGSNEEMLAKLQAGGTGWDVFVPTNYTINTYVELALIEKLDMSRLPNFDESASSDQFLDEMRTEGESDLWVVPKNWGTTGFIYNTNEIDDDITSWKQFHELAMGKYSGRAMVHDYQLTTIGNALKVFNHSFNSVDPAELADAEELLLEVKPHLFAITSDYQPAMRAGDAWMTACWNGDGLQLNRDLPEMKYVLGSEGGEIWVDTWAIVKDAPHRAAAYAFIDYMLNPAVAAAESVAHGYAQTDERAKALLPEAMQTNPVMYPPADLIANLEFGASNVLTDEGRAELMARFKAA
jgi:spermidine/putrescine transport system substrate-binding protein